MDSLEPQPEQQELLNPAPDPAITSESTAGLAELQQQWVDFRTLFHGALVGLIALCLAIDLFIGKQMLLVRRQIEEQRPGFARAEVEFKRNREPEMRRFMDDLHHYASTHPEFRSLILDRYRVALAPFFTTGAMVAEPPPIPTTPGGNPTRPPGR